MDEKNEFEQIATEEEDSQSSGQIRYELSTYPADFTLEVLCSKWEKGDIIIPDFQRNFVWSVSQSSKLIESFMLGLPVPPIFLYEDKSSHSLVIDGQQRLKSIFYFMGYEGKNAINEREKKYLSFKLKGLPEESSWYNKKFKDFAEDDVRALCNTVLRAIVVKQIDPDDNTSIYHVFERLNTGGTLLNNQEVRNCVYAGPFNDCLLKLNKYENWRKVFKNSIEDNRQKDVELILRFFTLYDELDEYKKPLKNFMSDYIGKRENRFMDNNKIETKEKIFKRTVDIIIEKIGEKPFHVRNGLNSAVCDSVMVAVAEHLDDIPANLKERFEQLNKDEKYIYYTSKATSDVASVKGRVQLARTYLFGDNK